MVEQIAAAANQQSPSTLQVNDTMKDMAAFTRQTAEGAPRSAQAVHELFSLALNLPSVVSRFKLPTNSRVEAA